MAKKYGAVSNRFPNLTIGADIQFRDGAFETDDEGLWAQLQANDWWGIHIHPRDEAPAEPAGEAATATAEGQTEEPKAEESEESSGWRARRGQRGSR